MKLQLEKTDAQKLSDSLLTACRAVGIEKPRFVAQDKDFSIWHYDYYPRKAESCFYANYGKSAEIDHAPYADDCRDSLMEWVEAEPKQETRLEGYIYNAHDGSGLIAVDIPQTSKIQFGQKVTVILQPTNETK